MPKAKASRSSESQSTSRPPMTQEAQENLMISLAMQCAEKQLRDGTASSQVITHYLKLVRPRNDLKKRFLRSKKN